MSVSEPAGVFFRSGSDDTEVTVPRSGVDGLGAAEPVGLAVTSDIDSIAEIWRAFEQVADCTVFQTFAWQSAWLRTVGVHKHVTPAIVIGRGQDGGIVFLLPLAIETAGSVRRMTWLASDLCDYNCPLLAPDFAERIAGEGFIALWRRIRRFLRQQPEFRFDAVVLQKMPERIGAQPNPFLALGVSLNASGAYLTHLAADWESFYLDRRSSATRRRDRTKRKRLGELGEVRFITPAESAGILRTLDSLFLQKSRSFARQGIADIFARPGVVDFFRAIATDAAAAGLVHVSELAVGQLVAAANFGLVFAGRYYHVLASYDDGPVSRFGPGAAHLRDLLQYAIAHRCTVFDFTIGDEPYKREWSDEELKLYDFFGIETPLGFVTALPSLVVARARRVIKQTPFLWSLARKVRVTLQRLRGKPATPAPKSDESADKEDAA